MLDHLSQPPGCVDGNNQLLPSYLFTHPINNIIIFIYHTINRFTDFQIVLINFYHSPYPVFHLFPTFIIDPILIQTHVTPSTVTKDTIITSLLNLLTSLIIGFRLIIDASHIYRATQVARWYNKQPSQNLSPLIGELRHIKPIQLMDGI